LFGAVDVRHISLSSNFWSEDRKVNPAYCSQLVKAFSMDEIKQAIFDMKQDSTPGSNGFGASFFQQFWDNIKGNYHNFF
jgi:hypothetical protein